MKTPSADLFQLVSALSLSERRYCNIYLAKHANGDDNRYLKLFEYLCTQSSYSSAATAKHLGYADKKNHYAVLKKQLYEQLLDALHQYDLFSNPEQQLLRSIHQCHLLLQKGLFAQCEKRMNGLQQTADEMNHYEAQLQLHNLKMIMYARKYYRGVAVEELKQWQQEADSIMQALAVSTNYRYSSSLAYKMQYEAGGRSKELAAKMKKLVKLPLFSNIKKATTLRAQLDYYQVNALYRFTNMEAEKAFEYNGKFIALLESKPVMQEQLADRYFSVLNNYLIDCLLLKKYDMLSEGLDKLRTLPQKPAFKRLANFDANVFRLGYLLELNWHIGTGNFTEAYKQAKDVKNGLAEYADKIVKHNRITLHYLMAYACFAIEKYDEALDWLWPILQEKEAAVAEDVQLAARMLQVLCHYEKQDALLLPSLVKSVRRLLQGKDGEADVQRAALTLISTNKAIGEKAWTKLADNIALLYKTNNSQGQSLFNYVVWAKAHASSSSYAKAWQANA